jgi:hypothetical protein
VHEGIDPDALGGDRDTEPRQGVKYAISERAKRHECSLRSGGQGTDQLAVDAKLE